ncbi:MAG: PAS domain-containing protein [Gammaproteobacteria bacterium]|nr:PAS domain-containing protein [Gammaproteobacteria bacterium]
MVVDDRLLTLYGVTRKNFEFTYENFITLIHPDDQASVKQAIDRTLEEGVPFEIEFRVIKPSDHSVHILAGRADVVRDPQGQPEFMIGVNWDITQQKRLEEDKLLNAVLRASQAVQSGTLFREMATMGQDWGTVKKELVMGEESPYLSVIPRLSKEGVALEHMKGLVEYRDILDYVIYQQAVKAIFPPSHYEVVSELKDSEEGYSFIVYNRADTFKKPDSFERKPGLVESEASSERPCCEIKVVAPGSRTLTSDIDTSIYVTGATGAHSLDVTFADVTVRNRGPDYNGRVRNQVIAHFHRISEELHHMTSSISRDSNAYADTITDDEKEYLKFNFTLDNNPIINGHFIIQGPLFYAEYKLTKHYQEQAASIIPMLRALTAEEWVTFKAQAINELQNRLKSIYCDKRHEDYFSVAETDLRQIFSLAETLHQEAEQTINHKIEQAKKERAEYWESSPLCKSPERLAMDMKISAMNRLYVDYLEKVIDTNNEIINLKQKQQDLVLQLEELHSHQNEINKELSDKNTEEEFLLTQQTGNVLTQQIKTIEQQLLTLLKQKAHKFLQKQALQIKANLFAHEAYINRSAVHHVVNGMLLNKGNIALSKQTIMGSALQQLGFRLNHANQLRAEHKSEGEIAYYCAKYSHRVFDLLFNNNESPLREVPYTEEQIENLTKDSTHNSLNVLARLKAVELQPQFHLFFTREEYQLLNSEMKIMTDVKKGDISTREKPEKAKALIKERMCLIDKNAYPHIKNITDEELQVFTKTTEKNLFISVAIKLMVAVYIAKLELKKGCLWSQVSTVQPSFFSFIHQSEASDVGYNFNNNNRLTYGLLNNSFLKNQKDKANDSDTHCYENNEINQLEGRPGF